ncbi:MAG TPA: hypothetical protein VGB42_03875, partial [Candidatus Thermoplasmatota archaeon]
YAVLDEEAEGLHLERRRAAPVAELPARVDDYHGERPGRGIGDEREQAKRRGEQLVPLVIDPVEDAADVRRRHQDRERLHVAEGREEIEGELARPDPTPRRCARSTPDIPKPGRKTAPST